MGIAHPTLPLLNSFCFTPAKPVFNSLFFNFPLLSGSIIKIEIPQLNFQKDKNVVR